MAIYVCDLCGWEYDEAKEEPFANKPDSYVCLVRHASKSQFSKFKYKVQHLIFHFTKKGPD